MESFVRENPRVVTLLALGALGGTVIALSMSEKPKRQKPKNNGRTKKISRTDRALLREKFSTKKIPSDVDTVIIGSGMGGLSCAAILARRGRKVLVLEQHEDVAGGGTHQFDLGAGYRFDSGLHYTVPWSEPVFALTCLKGTDEVCQFALMGDENDVVDKIYLHPVKAGGGTDIHTPVQSFDMITYEEHLKELYAQFPEEKEAIDQYMVMSDISMLFVKIFLFSRLLPKWLQDIYWRLIPRSIIATAATTAESILPRLTANKRLVSLLSSMWIDTGARPDKASFMMTASVFRGISMEAGCYPADGSEAMAIELAKTITENGGSILIRAPVEEISIDDRVKGVVVRDYRTGELVPIPCKRVVSAAGYVNTFGQLVAKSVTDKFKVPRALRVRQSAGFVMANIGLSASAESLGITCNNTWHIPIDDKTQDGFGPMRSFFADPLAGPFEMMPAFITFPSIKDRAWSELEANKNKVCCQMLMMAEYSWFSKYRDAAAEARKQKQQQLVGETAVLAAEYEELKSKWAERAVSLLKMYYPQVEGHVDLVDISTPLTIENYLHAKNGSAVGIDVTPERFVDPAVRRRLDPVTEIPGLYLTGQDTVTCGVTLAQISGVITAFRMEGFCAAVSVLGQSIWRDIATSLHLR